jgi:hypothetical protein
MTVEISQTGISSGLYQQRKLIGTIKVNVLSFGHLNHLWFFETAPTYYQSQRPLPVSVGTSQASMLFQASYSLSSPFEGLTPSQPIVMRDNPTPTYQRSCITVNSRVLLKSLIRVWILHTDFPSRSKTSQANHS